MTTLRHVIIKLIKFKDKESILKAAKQPFMYKGIPTRLSADFYSETCRPEGSDQYIQSAGKKANCEQGIFYPEKSFTFEGEIQSFLDKQKVKGFITASLTLEDVVKGILQVETEGH